MVAIAWIASWRTVLAIGRTVSGERRRERPERKSSAAGRDAAAGRGVGRRLGWSGRGISGYKRPAGSAARASNPATRRGRRHATDRDHQPEGRRRQDDHGRQPRRRPGRRAGSASASSTSTRRPTPPPTSASSPTAQSPSMYDVLVEQPPAGRRPPRRSTENLWLAAVGHQPGRRRGRAGRRRRPRGDPPRRCWPQDAEPFDFVLMDCGPSLGVLTLNALAAADEVFIPLQPHFLALHGLGKLLETTALVAERINPALKVTGVVVCLYDAATKLAQEVVSDLTAFLEQQPRRRTCRGRRRGSSTRGSAGTSSWPSARASASRSSTTRRTAPAPRTTRRWRTKSRERSCSGTASPTRGNGWAAARYNPCMIRVSVANPYEQDLDFQGLKAAARAVLEGRGRRARRRSRSRSSITRTSTGSTSSSSTTTSRPTSHLPVHRPRAKKLEGEIVIGYEVATVERRRARATTSRRS